MFINVHYTYDETDVHIKLRYKTFFCCVHYGTIRKERISVIYGILSDSRSVLSLGRVPGLALFGRGSTCRWSMAQGLTVAISRHHQPTQQST